MSVNGFFEINKKNIALFFLVTIVFAGLINIYASQINTAEQSDNPENLKLDIGGIDAETMARQDFRLSSGILRTNMKLDAVTVMFTTYGGTARTDGVVFHLYDDGGKLLCERRIRAAELSDNSYFDIILDGIPLSPDREYHYTLTGTGIPGRERIVPGVILTGTTEELGELTINGKVRDGEAIRTIFQYSYDDYLGCVILFAEWLLFGLCIFASPSLFNRKKNKFFVLCSVLLNLFLLEQAGAVLGGFNDQILASPRVFTYIILFLLVILAWGMCGSFFLAGAFVDLLYLLYVFINVFVLEYRGTPLSPSDLLAVGTLGAVIGTYTISLDVYQMAGMAAAVMLLVFWLKGYWHKNRKKGLLSGRTFLRLVSVALPIYLLAVLARGTLLEQYDIVPGLWNRESIYYSNGPLVNFWANFQFRAIQKPDGYSVEAAKAILDEYPASESGDDSVKPNIIMIMNESMCDYSLIPDGKLSLTSDPLPFIHGLGENSVKGRCYVSALGGGTANSELEALTGNSIAFYPRNSVPYTIFPQENIMGLAQEFKELSYYCVAIHPSRASNWNRKEIYGAMGFDRFVTAKSFKKPEYVRGWISDKSTYKKIIRLYKNKEEGQPLFVFDVTIQGHGGYDNDTAWDNPIEVNGRDYTWVKELVSSTRVSDEAFEYLVNYFEKQAEPTVILMFGDHQPGVEGEFYREMLDASDLQKILLEDTQKLYITPYVLWANYDIPESEKDLSTNQLGGLLKEAPGLPLTSYQQFIRDFSSRIPVINMNGYRDKDGNWHELDEENEYLTWIERYRIVQYYIYNDCCGWEVNEND